MRSDNCETEAKSLTDDLPVCYLTGAGFSTNQIYRDDGTRQEEHKFYDRSFHCQQIDVQTCLYAICSGQNGHKVAEFAIQRITAEILFGQLNNCTPEEVKDLLRQTFVSVEKDYLNSIDHILMRKTVLQCQIPDGINHYEISCKYKEILTQLIDINNHLTIGSSAALALIYGNKLYISNIGNCRALLCKTDENNVLRVIQLSVDHNITNEDEVLRLSQLGLDVQAIKQSPFTSTRCIGCYSGKAGYKDSFYLSGAQSEPVLSTPEIVGPIPVDDSCRFLVIMSGGLCKTLQDIYSNETNIVNREIIKIIVEQFRTQSTLSGVSQAAVHKVVQLHHDTYMRQTEEPPFKKREDITLLVRNFNFPMPNAIQTQRYRNNVTFNPVVEEHSNALYSSSDTNSIINTTNSFYTNTNSSTSSSDRGEIYNKNIRIQPYVDFSDYYKKVETARANGKLAAFIDFD